MDSWSTGSNVKIQKGTGGIGKYWPYSWMLVITAVVGALPPFLVYSPLIVIDQQITHEKQQK